MIILTPHIVWQESEEIENLSLEISKFKTTATKLGYVVCSGASTKCTTCYTENIDQYVINYNLNVYKCTARDFSHANSIGYIQTDGTFKPNGLYYKFISEQSPFINNRCLDCEILPSCLYATSCIQKKIEGYSPECPKHLILQDIRQSIHSQIQSQSASKYHEKN